MLKKAASSTTKPASEPERGEYLASLYSSLPVLLAHHLRCCHLLPDAYWPACER